jgi:hypothetical protein
LPRSWLRPLISQRHAAPRTWLLVVDPGLFLLLQEKKRILIFARTNRRRRVVTQRVYTYGYSSSVDFRKCSLDLARATYVQGGGGYARIYLKFTILKKLPAPRARGARARASREGGRDESTAVFATRTFCNSNFATRTRARGHHDDATLATCTCTTRALVQ